MMPLVQRRILASNEGEGTMRKVVWIVITVLGLLTTAAASSAAVTITPVVGGLAAPRGIAFDGVGNMYVAESGVAGAGKAGLTQTGKVDKFAWGQTKPSWSTRFNS